MWGAIIGDLAGSIYEYEEYNNVHPIKIKEIINNDCFFSDDSILTIALLDSILNNKDYETNFKEYVNKYNGFIPKDIPYFKNMFSPNFSSWAKSNIQGRSRGNGAMMRISPVGYLFDSEEEIRKNVVKATVCSHNSNEAIECSTIIALIIFFARKGLSKEEIMTKLNLKINYVPITKFNTTCYDTITNCLYALFNSNNFNQSIKEIISYGGDTDTNACIVGSMAEALYGIDLKLITEAKKIIPEDFVKKLEKGYSKIKVLKNNF